jgi:hypothetical protein
VKPDIENALRQAAAILWGIPVEQVHLIVKHRAMVLLQGPSRQWTFLSEKRPLPEDELLVAAMEAYKSELTSEATRLSTALSVLG